MLTFVTCLTVTGLKPLETEVVFTLTSIAPSLRIVALVPVRVVIVGLPIPFAVIITSIICTAEKSFINGMLRRTKFDTVRWSLSIRVR